MHRPCDMLVKAASSRSTCLEISASERSTSCLRASASSADHAVEGASQIADLVPGPGQQWRCDRIERPALPDPRHVIGNGVDGTRMRRRRKTAAEIAKDGAQQDQAQNEAAAEIGGVRRLQLCRLVAGAHRLLDVAEKGEVARLDAVQRLGAAVDLGFCRQPLRVSRRSVRLRRASCRSSVSSAAASC